MSDRGKTIIENLTKIVELAHELGWKSLIIADPGLTPRGILCGPSGFIEDFKEFTNDMAQLEQELDKFVKQNGLEDKIKEIQEEKKENNGDDGNSGNNGGTTWH